MADAAPAGGAFLNEAAEVIDVFTPEDLPSDARLMARTMDEFVRREVLPMTGRLDTQEPGLMRSLVRQAGKLGLLGASMPREYGGLSVAKTTAALLAEKSGADLAFAITLGVHSGVGSLPLLLFGTEAQRRRYLPGLASGDIIAAFALSEGNSGSDALAAQTRATGPLAPDNGGTGKHFLLDGTKLWVTNGGFADLFTIFAQAPGGFTAFLVSRDTRGLSLSGEEQKLGLRASSTRRVFLSDVHLPADAVLGEVGSGHRPALYALNAGRFNIGAIALGGAKEALRIATDYALNRRQSGRPIAEFGLVADKLAEMAIRIFALESMVYRTAGYWDASLAGGRGLMETLEEYAVECAVIKFLGTEVLGYAVDECLQIHGGFGYSEEFPAARLYRDARVFRIFEGTNEINRLTVIDQIRRRIQRGRIGPLRIDIDEGNTAIALLRSLAQFVVDKVIDHGDNQQACAAAADIVALLYAVESATLRVDKTPSSTNTDIVDAFVESALVDAVRHARTALAAVDVPFEEARPFLKPFIDRPFVNASGLKLRIASEVRACGGYVCL